MELFHRLAEPDSAAARKLVVDLETVVTATEKEAAVLENDLIKKNKPRFNVKLRDDKDFLCLRLDPRKDHRMWSESMCFGVYNYVRQFAVIHPRMHVMSQLIWEKLRIGPDGQASFRFTDPPREFRDYAHYVAEFEAAMAALWKNATDARRQRPMRAVASASRGYDSSTVLAFATKVVGPGLLSWSAPRSNTRMPAAVQKLLKTNLSDDDGSDIAHTLAARHDPCGMLGLWRVMGPVFRGGFQMAFDEALAEAELTLRSAEAGS